MLLSFLQGPDGENSSKRLIGVVGGFIFLYLALFSGFVLLLAKDIENFLDVLTSIGYFSSYHLTTGIADHFLKKRL